jgi:hypothetical protein
MLLQLKEKISALSYQHQEADFIVATHRVAVGDQWSPRTTPLHRQAGG